MLLKKAIDGARLCPQCGGRGWKYHYLLSDELGQSAKETCLWCQGTGLITEEEVKNDYTKKERH